MIEKKSIKSRYFFYEKMNLCLVTVIVLGMVLNGCSYEIDLEAIKFDKSKIIAHRGYWDIAGSAQNSIKALELADQLGIYGSEFDVHLTADNILIVNHDRMIGEIDIQTSNYDAIKDQRLSNGEIIPKLEIFFDVGKQLTIMLICEIKPHGTKQRNIEAAQEVVNMVRKKGLENRVEYISFSLDICNEIIRMEPSAKVMYLNGDLSPQSLKELGLAGFDYHPIVMNEHMEYFTEAKTLGLTAYIWTINDVSLMKKYFEAGADFITTDNIKETVIERGVNF
jgi:glycerophosphoryl diester phosphodiesterase